MILVHDISHWQGDLTKYWQLFKDKGCKAIIIQSSNGLYANPYFRYATNEAKEQGFLVGSYHYYRQHIPNSEGTWIPCDPLKQANNYFNWVQKVGVVMDLPPALDIENAGNPQGLSASSIEKTLGHIERMFGRVPIIYSNPAILKGLAKPGWERYPLWLAHYADKPTVPAPWKSWTLWQFSDKITYTPAGSTAKKPIDHNWFNGTLKELNNLAGIATPPTDGGEPAGDTPTGGGNNDHSYLQKQIELIGSRVKNIENFLGSYRSSLSVTGSGDTRTEASS